MNHALLSRETDSAEASKTRTGGLRINKPGDSFEREADRVAETVTSGGYIPSKFPGWSFASPEKIQRQSASQFPNWQGGQQAIPTPNNYGDAVGKALEAFFKTKEGEKILQQLENEPLAKKPEGIAVGASAAAAVVGTLAVGHQPLPVQIPAVPLDKISPKLAGFKVKLTYNGPVDRPTGGMLTLSYEGKSDKKKDTDSDRYRAETARMAADQEKLRAGLQPKTGPLAEQERKEGQWIQDWSLRRVGTLPRTGLSWDPRQMGKNYPQHELDRYSLTGTSPGTSTDKKTPAAAATTQLPADAPKKEKKKEELPVQRKALGEVAADLDFADVDAVLRSSARPLDYDTRRFMESRIGFDFGKVRIHTDTRAASSARAMGAQAYTVGSDVVFGAGRYAPQTTQGRRLLAHELTHVVQQSSPTARPHPAVHAAPRQVQRFWGLNLPDIKEWLLGKLKQVKGYDLFCVVIGEDLATGQQVEQNATNLTKGVLSLFGDGPALFEKLKKAAAAIDTAYKWVLAQLTELDLTKEYFSKLLDRAVAAVELRHPYESFERVKDILREPYDKLVELASRLAKAVLDFILKAVLENFPLGKKIYEMFKKAGAVISRIAADPISFAHHLLDALKLGFSNFGANILKHLGEGLKRWIFEEINLPDLKIPDKFDFSSILQLVLQALKLTYEQRRPQLVEKLGEQVVYFFETAADILLKIKKEGFVAIWNMIKQKAENLFDSVLDKVRNWVVEQIVKMGLAKVAALATPIGDAIEIIADIYETIEFFIEKATKFVELIDGIVNSLSDMVDGKIDAAAKKVEDTLANSIPLVLRFLAGIFHLSGIGESIRKIIDSVRKPIDDAIGKVLDFIVDKAMPIWEKGKEAFLGKLAAVKDWWKKPKKFHYGEEEHELSVEGQGDHPQIFVQSAKTPLEHFLSDVKATPAQTKDILKLAGQLGWRQGELQKPADDEKGSRAYEKLADMLDHLKARKEPETQINYKEPVHSLGGGVEADVYLSANHPVGTEPHGKDPDIWNDLGKLLPSKHYVRGHLLSMRLGGIGEWKNMMPITNTVNQRMNSQVENSLKKATVPGKNRYFHYTVKAEYKDNVLPPIDEKAPAAEKKQRALDAEKRLVSLKWTVKPAEPKESGGWKETTGKLLDADGNEMKDTVAQGGFTPPTD